MIDMNKKGEIEFSDGSKRGVPIDGCREIIGKNEKADTHVKDIMTQIDQMKKDKENYEIIIIQE
jgi:hypothetical protein